MLLSVYRWKWYITGLVVLLVYLSIIIGYAENIPYADDLAILSSLYDIQHAPNWYVKLKILFSFHNEHRIAIPRIITVLLYYLQHQHINIAWWIIIGNASIFLLLYLYFKAGFVEARKRFFLPVLFLVLQPMHCELMYWGMASLQNIGVLVLSSLSFYYLLYSKNNILPLLFAVLSVFTSANGLFTFIVGITLLFYQKDWYKCLVWALVGIISGFLYWSGFIVGENSGDGFGSSFQIIRFLTTFISLTGGVAYTQSFPAASLLFGFSLLTVIALIYYYIFVYQSNMINKSPLFLLCCLTFILLTIVAISLGRNPSNILSGSRYKLYPTLILALTYLLLIDRFEKRQYVFKMALSVGVLFWGLSYIHYTSRFSVHSRLLFSHFYNWRYSGMIDVSPPNAQTYYAERWRKFYQAGHYIPPQKVIDKCQRILTRINEKTFQNVSLYFEDKDVSINPIRLPVREYYAVNKAKYKSAIYPLNSSTNKLLFPSQDAEYSTSIRSSYWLKDPEESVFVIAVD